MGVTINKKKASGDWYVWISYKNQRTSRKIGKDRRTAMKAATMYRKKLALGEILQKLCMVLFSMRIYFHLSCP